MANIGHKQKYNEHKVKILCSANNLFLQKGYTLTTMADIAKEAKVDKNTVFYVFKDKETLLSMIVSHVINCQYDTVKELLKGETNKLYIYAVETTLQLYMAESSEHLREMYNVSYSLKKPSEEIYQTVAKKLIEVFSEYNSGLELKDYYELELAVGGMMRSFMTVPCDMYFTINRKVKRFLESVFLIFRIPSNAITKALEFASKFNYEELSSLTINKLQKYIEGKIKENL